jgi:hypothetical protein
VVEYRLRAEFAPQSASNVHLRTAPITMVRPGTHGLSTLSLSIVQSAAQPIQVDLGSPVELTPDTSPTLRDGWGNGIGARAGISTLRLGSHWSDLLDIRPAHAPGVFTARGEEVIFSGLLTIGSIWGPFGQVNPEWGPTSGGGSFHGYLFYPTGPNFRFESWGTPIQDTESSSDPLTHFTPLTLTAANFEAAPEPSTFALAGAALIGLALLRRKRRFGDQPRESSTN